MRHEMRAGRGGCGGLIGAAWWPVAALCAAAQAFEVQARDWAARAKHDGVGGGLSRIPHPRVARPDEHDGHKAWSS